MINAVHLLLLLIGVVLRLAYFFHVDALSVSEAYYAENILARSFTDIFYHRQILPDQPLNALGFYVMQKTATLIWGESEAALRIYPLLCSLAGLFLFYYISRCCLSAFGATMALAFFALSEWLVVTAGMVSPYAADVLAGLLAVFIYEQVKRREFRPGGMILLAVAGAAGMWFSYAGLLVWLAVLLCLTEAVITLRYVRRIPSLMGIIAVWSVSFLCLYLVCLSHLVQSSYAWHPWLVYFPPGPYWSWGTLYWTVDVFLHMFAHPVDMAFPLIGVIFFLAGTAGLVRRNPEHAALLILPVGLTFLVAGFRFYPAIGLGVIFLLPFVYMMIAAGIDWVWSRFARIGLWISMLVFACLLIQPLTHLTDAMAAVSLYRSGQDEAPEMRRGEIVMLGDSLFALNNWSGYFRHPAIHNLGVVGDRIDDVRLRVGEVRRLAPEKVFVLVGINDHPDTENVDDLVRQYRRLILELQRALPQSRIYVSTLLPINSELMRRRFSIALDNAAVRRFNRELRRVAAERRVELIDSYRALAVNGELPERWTTDGVHLSPGRICSMASVSATVRETVR